LGLLVAVGLFMAAGTSLSQEATPISFGKSVLSGTSSTRATSLQFGPDGRLYVAQQDGTIKAYGISRTGPNQYTVTATETITAIKSIPNHNDDGTPNTTLGKRQVTGILVKGTASQPVVYASSSDPRIGGNDAGTDTNLDTNSGVVSKLTKTSTGWQKVDLVRGLPRSEENHSVNGMQLSGDGTKLYLAVGGNTNKGAPSNNFAYLPEYALSAAVLSVDLAAIGNTTYDLPTLDDDTRTNASTGVDSGDPFGGNDGKNQAKIVSGGPVQVYSPGYRNAYDLVIAQSGKMYTVDNGGNAGWGDKPIGEGPEGTCTNAPSEPGTTDTDTLHLIKAAGYYGGHPNPVRANKAITYNADKQSPVATANPVECDYRTNGTEKGNLTQFFTSANGLAEYTASSFGGAMKGDLLVAGFDNNVYRTKLNSTGDGVVLKEKLFQTVSTVPLDVTAQGDGGPFPGTIWTADITTAGTVTVFEPASATSCDATNDPALDSDADGYDNADEVSSGTDPCSAADVPPDADGDKTSDKTDPDDDNDGQPDTTDPYAVDKNNGKATELPVEYTWNNDAPSPGGLLNLGFTGLMTNNKANYQSLYNPANMTAGGAAGAVTVDKVPAGDAARTSNTQKYGFQFGVNVGPSTGVFTAHTRILAPFKGLTPQDYQSMGLFIGTGDQDNYVKLVTAANAGAGGIEFGKEVAGSLAVRKPRGAVKMPGPDSVDLYLTVDPSAGTVQPSYAVTTGGVTGPRTLYGAPEPIPASWLDGTKALAVGTISTSVGPGPEFPATWDSIKVVPGDGQQQESTSAATFTISHPKNALNASTYTTGTFKLKNDSKSGQKIKKVRIDLGSSLLPDMLFDPKGTAGDKVAKCFTPDSGTAAVGLVAPADPCASPFAEARDGGYEVLGASFGDFGPGETFTFSTDADPTSIKGVSAPGPGESGSVSGLELAGAQVTVEFDDGSVRTAQTFRTPDTIETSPNVSASKAMLGSGLPPKPGIQVLGVAAPAKVTGANQTVRITGPAGASASLLLAEAGLFTSGVPNGGYDLDPFEANNLLAVLEKPAKIGQSGYVDVPVTLTRSATNAGRNHLVAVLEDASGRHGPASSVLVLELGASSGTDTTAPTVTGTLPAVGATGVSAATNVEAAFSEAMDPATISGATLTLVESGATGPVSATVAYDATNKKAILNPSADLKPGATYAATVKGGTGGVKDLAGNALVADKTWSFTTAAAATGGGLKGEYFDNQDLTNLKLTRTDPSINFAWGYGSPAASIASDSFSARWSGQVKADHSETYTFYTTANDGVRLWVDGKLIVNRWSNGSTTNTATIPLVAGKWYPIKLEYYEGVKTANVKLEYSSPSTARKVIPSDHLSPQ